MDIVSIIIVEKIWAYKMKHFTILLIFTVLLSGCAKKDPVDNIVDNHSSHIGDVLEYAYNNLEQTAGVMFLEGELKSCQMALLDVKESHHSVVDGYKAKISYWRLMVGSLIGVVLLLVGILIKRWLR